MRTTILLLFSFFIGSFSFAQSLNGNFNAAESKAALSYGNVDVYRDGKLVASVLTDRAGNFHIPLDTGKYTCVVSYAGYLPITKEIAVKSDEMNDFTAEADKTKKQPAPKLDNEKFIGVAYTETTTLSTVSGGSKAYSWSSGESEKARDESRPPLVPKTTGSGLGLTDGLFAPPPTVANQAKSGALTAGEINDFSKWKMWQDITGSELSTYQSSWNIAPKGRYTLMLQGKTGLPLVDATVKLMEGRKILFTTKTDNTGKAECWLTIKNENPVLVGPLSIEVSYLGQTKKIDRVTPFEESINHMALTVECQQIENVDIAFVVDATGSMGDELNYLKAEMNDIIYKSKQISNTLNFRFANVFYRDKGVNELYLTQKMDFNRILSESVHYVDGQYAGGGGDYEEAVESALDTAINTLQWSENARTRVLFLILDAPPHNNPEVQAKLERLTKQAAEKGIRIVPIGASGINKSTEYLMRAMALGTNGTYTFLTNHSGIGGSHIAPSTDKFDVETLNDLIVRILKSYTYMPDCDQQIPDLAMNYPDSIVVVPDSVPGNDSVPVRDSLNHQIPDPVKVTWSYYPNPTDGIVNILSETDIPELYITDLSGKLLQTITKIEAGRTVQVDLGAYSTGIYLIRYPVGKTWVSGKVVLQR